MKVVILAGGGGTRLYPLSNPNAPKQFLPLANEKPLLVNTIERFLPLCKQSDMVVVTGERYRELTEKTLAQFGYSEIGIAYEPCARNTAPAIALAVRYLVDVKATKDDEPILVVPSDHVISPQQVYLDSVKMVVDAARQGKIVTVGIVPRSPDTGFGYIMAEHTASTVKKVLAFQEKPDLETAKSYLQTANYYWNAGMYAFTEASFGNELERHAPSLFDFYKRGYQAMIESFADTEKISIDYALAEKSQNIMVVPYSGNWSDIGSWDSYYDFCDKDASGNVIIGKVQQAGCKNCLLANFLDGEFVVEGQNEKIIVLANGSALIRNKR